MYRTWLVLLLCALSSISHSQTPTARVTGTIFDTSAKSIPGASVTATNQLTGATISGQANEQGIYSLPFLNPGTYEIRVEAKGFRQYVRTNITLETAQVFMLDVTLQVGDVSQSVTVTEAQPLLESARSILLFHRGEDPMLRLSPSGSLHSTWGKGLFQRPHSVRTGPDGSLWTVDAGAHTVLKHDREGRILMVFGRRGDAGESPERFDQPTDIAFAPNGDFFVTDGYGNSRVVKYARDGVFLKAWGRKGAGPGEFNLPHSAVVMGQRLLVADRENYRIQIFDLEGRFLEQWTDLGSPWGLAVSPAGDLWMADGYNNRILKLTPEGKVVGVLGVTGRLPGQFRYPHMLAVDREDRVYVTEILNWRAQRLVPKAVPTGSGR